jgi:chromosomal replication initiator protein DnaA
MQNQLREHWEKAKEFLKEEMTSISFETWVKTLEPMGMENSNITLKASSVFQKDMIESRYLELIKNTFNFITNRDCTIYISFNEQEETEEQPSNIENIYGYSNYSLNPKYTFDTFVVGNNNRFAHAAALAVSESPAASYNPLFLYGGVGLGKTHLMQAIGNFILSQNPNSKVLYVTSEKFTNELINAIKDNRNEEFRLKYRNIDLLLIDDIQFIAGKERIQEEFHNTFNTLHENGKQIVISSDKPPKDIYPLEERLKSRFEWGLIADIQQPDYETRLAILRKKSQSDKIIINDEILSAIAEKMESNIRELEGALNKIIAYASLTNSEITMETTYKAIGDMSSSSSKVVSIEYIQKVIAKFFDLKEFDLKSSKRSNDITFPRQIAMYLCRDIIGASLPKIGDAFGGRDHTTVLHACNKIKKDIKINPETKSIVDNVKRIIISQ